MLAPKYDKQCGGKNITNSEIRRIKRVIYRTFEKFKDQKIINSADFVVSLDLEKLIKSKDNIKFSYLSIARSIILMKIRKLKFQTKLVKYLKENDDVALKLGFEPDDNNKPMPPDQRTFSYYVNHAFDKKALETINCVADIIGADSERFGIVFDEHAPEIKPVQKEENKYQLQYKMEQKRRSAYKLAKRILIPHVSFPYMGHNCKYFLNDYLQLAVQLSLNKEFANGGSEQLRMKQNGIPPGQDLLYHIKKFEGNLDGMMKMFTDASEVILKEVKRKTILFERKVNIAIDHTEIWYFVRKNRECIKYLPLATRMVKNPKSTKYCIRYIVVSVVDKGKKYVLLALPATKARGINDEHKIVEKALEYVKTKVKINVLSADRHFSQDSEYINLFKKLGLQYVMIAKRTAEIKKMAEEIKDRNLPYARKNIPFGNSHINIIIAKGRKEKRIVFITNMDFSADNDNQVRFLAAKLDRLYSERWNIETTFKQIKEILARTTTNKNYSIRLFYFLLAVNLYNLWIMGESLLSLFKYGKIIKKNSISLKVFIRGLLSEMPVT
jgi:hypothetical protein